LPNITIALIGLYLMRDINHEGPRTNTAERSGVYGYIALKRLNKYLIGNAVRILAITELAGTAMFLNIEFFEHMEHIHLVLLQFPAQHRVTSR